MPLNITSRNIFLISKKFGFLSGVNYVIPIWAAGAALVGVPMEQIRDALGHSTVKITEQHYAQIHPDYREKAREYAKRTYAPNATVQQ